MEYKGIEYMRRKMLLKSRRVNTRYAYYDMKNRVRDIGIALPDNMKQLKAVLGWCETAVDSLADRIEFREFRNDIMYLSDIFDRNNPDVLFDSAILGALIGSCDFIYISPDEDGFPRLQVIDGANATGMIDPVTNLLIEGYAVLARDTETHRPIKEAYFVAGRTDYYDRGRLIDQTEHAVEHPLLVPIIYRPDAKRPFGHSRITRSCMELQKGAIRTLMRSEVTAEFYSFPQKYATGLNPDAEELDNWRATVSTMLTFTKDDDGDSPTLGQFTQASAAPHFEQLKLYASLFAGEVGLTLYDMGFPESNPASVQAIRANHEKLNRRARKAQKTFGAGFINAGYLAACLRDDYAYSREMLFGETATKVIWEPIFAPDAAELAGIGDAVLKIQQAFPDYFDSDKLRDMTGI